MPHIAPPPPYPQKPLSQQQKIVAMMCSHPEKQWWLPTDFMKGGEFFVGYEASARLSELQKENPAIFETRPAGKYKERRMRFETGKEWFATAPKDIKKMVLKYYERGKQNG